MDPVSSHVNHLQKRGTSQIVKNNIISTFPNSPKESTYAYPNATLRVTSFKFLLMHKQVFRLWLGKTVVGRNCVVDYFCISMSEKYQNDQNSDNLVPLGSSN